MGEADAVSTVVRYYCNGTGEHGGPCGAWLEVEPGAIRASALMLKRRGWTMARGYSADGKRPRLDFCGACTKRRRAARKNLRAFARASRPEPTP